jgi:hypothetical protein
MAAVPPTDISQNGSSTFNSHFTKWQQYLHSHISQNGSSTSNRHFTKWQQYIQQTFHKMAAVHSTVISQNGSSTSTVTFPTVP